MYEHRGLSALALCLCIAATLPVAAESAGMLRVESLDAVTADYERISGSSMDLLGLLAGAAGVADLSFIDRARPFAVTLPVGGMMFGQAGAVAVVPVKDVQAALDALGEQLGEAEVHDGNVHEWKRDAAPPLIAHPRERYLVLGQNRTLVAGVSPDELLATPLPAGSVALDLALEPISPFIMAGLTAARAEAEKAMADAAEGEEATPGTAALEEALTGPIIDLYFDVIGDLVRNTSRIQASVEMTADDIVSHTRLVPRASSTLHGMIEAQSGGLPDLARFVEAEKPTLAMAGQISYTPAFTEALSAYMARYAEILGQAFEVLPEDDPDGADRAQVAAFLDIMTESMNGWRHCNRGDFVTVLELDAEKGFRMNQLGGATDAAACREVLAGMTDISLKTRIGEDGRFEFHSLDGALSYKGHEAIGMKLAIDLGESARADDPGTSAAFDNLLKDGMQTYMATVDDIVVYTAGPDAEQEFKTLVDRLAKPKQRKRGGLDAAAFAPLRVGPGIFARYDLGGIADWVPAGEEQEEIGAAMEVLSGISLTYGLRFDDDAVSLEVAFPLAPIQSLIGGEDDAETAPPAASDADQG